MIYAYLYHKSTGWNGTDFSGPVKDIPMCGSDSVVFLDGRKILQNQIQDTLDRIAKHMRKGEITGFQIIQAQSLREDGHKLTKFIPV